MIYQIAKDEVKVSATSLEDVYKQLDEAKDEQDKTNTTESKRKYSGLVDLITWLEYGERMSDSVYTMIVSCPRCDHKVKLEAIGKGPFTPEMIYG